MAFVFFYLFGGLVQSVRVFMRQILCADRSVFASLFQGSYRGAVVLSASFFLSSCVELPEKLQGISIVALEKDDLRALRGAQLAIERVNAAGGVKEGRSLLWSTSESAAASLDENAFLFLTAEDALAEESAALFSANALHLSLSRSEALSEENGDTKADFWNFAVLSPARYSAKIYAQLFATGKTLEPYTDALPQLILPQCSQAAMISINDAAGNVFTEVFAQDFQARGGRISAAQKISFTAETESTAKEALATALAALDENIAFCVLLDVPNELAVGWAELLSSALGTRDGAWSILASARAAQTDLVQRDLEQSALAQANLPVGHLFALKPHLDFAAKPSSEFAVAFQSRFDEMPSIKDAAAYDAASLMAFSLLVTEQENAEAVRDALLQVSQEGIVQDGAESFAPIKAALQAGENIDYKGASGQLDFDDEAGVKTDFALVVPERIFGEMTWNAIAKIPAALWD